MVIDTEVAKKLGLSYAQVMCMFFANSNITTEEKNDLLKRGIIGSTASPRDYFTTTKGKNYLRQILANSGSLNTPMDNERLTELAKKLKEIYPKGKKEGTSYYWADSVSMIVIRLKLFFKRYGEDFTDEQIINATKNYVEGFNGGYQYMQILKYFIMKDKVGNSGHVEPESQLLNYIDNEGQEDNLKDNWTTELI